MTGCTTQYVRHYTKECMYVDFLHHLCTGLHRMVIHSVIIRFKTWSELALMILFSALPVLSLVITGMLLCSDVLCA